MKGEVVKELPNELVVYYEAWQMKCCGKPFSLGDKIEFTVEFRRAQIKSSCEDIPSHYDCRYEGHGNLTGNDQYILIGSVKSIFLEYTLFKYINKVGTPVRNIYIKSDCVEKRVPDYGKTQHMGYIVVVEPKSLTRKS